MEKPNFNFFSFQPSSKIDRPYHFENFIHFSSAVERLKNFKYKLKSKLSNNDFLREIYKVRVGNGQNKIFVLFLLFLKYSKYNLKKILKL